MDFRDYAAKEASELAVRLTKAATTAAEQAVRHVGDEAKRVADGLREQLQAAAKDKAATAALLKDAQAHTERVKAELNTTSERVEVAGRQLAEARKTVEKLEAARTDLSAARDEQARARRDAETDLRKAREAVDSLRGELASAMKTLDKAAAERLASEEVAAAAASNSQAAEAKLAAVTDLFNKNASRIKTLEQGEQDYRRRIQDLESSLKEARSAPAPAAAGASVLDELVAGFQALAGATTIGEMLTTLVEQMAAQFPRVALFRVKKGHLQGEHQIGFDLKTDIGKLVLPLGMDSLPSRAASSGQIESLAGAELKDHRSPFSGTPRCALAVPIVVAGDTLAVVYADDSGAPHQGHDAAVDEVRARYVEAMQHYAVAVLMRLNKELKALAELQKYAASLLHEMEQMYEADAESGLAGADLQKRLEANLEFARSIYGSRTALEGADAATLIDDELNSLIEARAGTPFGRDLAAAAGDEQASPRGRAAEAS